MNKVPSVTSKNTLNLDNYVPALVTLLANKLSSGASACYRKHFGIGVTEWRLLALLAVENNITSNRVAQVVGLDKGAISRAVKQSVAKGWVVLTKDREDARQTLIQLTRQGRSVHDKILQVALKRESLLLGGLSEDEIETLVKLLQHLIVQIPSVNDYDPVPQK